MEKRRTNRRKLKNVVRVLPVVCCGCDQETSWSDTRKVVPSECRGVIHEFEVEMLKCEHCENTIFGEGHTDKWQKSLKEEHKQYVSEICKKKRNALGLTQDELADRSDFGIATIKRIESAQIYLRTSNERNLLECLSSAEFIGYGLGSVVTPSPSAWGNSWVRKGGAWFTHGGAIAASLALSASLVSKEGRRTSEDEINLSA